jgi:hypothetical protein
MLKELIQEWREDPDPAWLKILAVVVISVGFCVMVML